MKKRSSFAEHKKHTGSAQGSVIRLPEFERLPEASRTARLVIMQVVAAITSVVFVARDGLVPWPILIFIAGAVGGVVSNFRRIQKLSLAKVKNSAALPERLMTIQVSVSPLVGGVFATVLNWVFMSGLVQGSLFPTFQSAPESFTTFRQFAALAIPDTNADAAKALVWAFIAGFSEGLVPNIISKITKASSQNTDAKNAGTGHERVSQED